MIAFVVGTRPNFMKAAPIFRRIGQYNIEETLIHTGQHYSPNMNDIFFKELGLPEPDYNLGIKGGSPNIVLGRLMKGLHEVFLKIKPQRIVVMGDVSSTLAAALAAAYLHLPIDHIEAGLRAYDRRLPEEINRVLVDHLSSRRFATEPAAMENLKKEGLTQNNFLVGDLMLQNLKDLKERIKTMSGEYGVVTVHRAHNVDERENLEKVLKMINTAAEYFRLIFPIHPRTAQRLKRFGLDGTLSENVELVEPMGYLEFIGLVQGARVLLTDSGSLQTEASYLDVPCLTLRENTERPITIEKGTNTLVGLNLERLQKALDKILDGEYKHAALPDFLWNGVAERILEVLEEG